MQKLINYSFIWLLVVTIILGFSSAVKGQRSMIGGKWQVEKCYTNGCIEALLNSLSAETAADAKLTTWDNKTYVWYRK